MGSVHLADVVSETVNRVLVEVRSSIAHRRIRVILDTAEAHVRYQIQWIQRGVALRNQDAEFGAVDQVRKLRSVGQVVLADGKRRLIEQGRANRVGGVQGAEAARLFIVNRAQNEVQRSGYPSGGAAAVG